MWKVLIHTSDCCPGRPKRELLDSTAFKTLCRLLCMVWTQHEDREQGSTSVPIQVSAQTEAIPLAYMCMKNALHGLKHISMSMSVQQIHIWWINSNQKAHSLAQEGEGEKGDCRGTLTRTMTKCNVTLSELGHWNQYTYMYVMWNYIMYEEYFPLQTLRWV